MAKFARHPHPIVMKRVIVVLLSALAISSGAHAQAAPTPMQRDSIERASLPAANPADVASLDAILAALYDVISGPAGQKRDWNRFRSLFVPGARLIPTQHPQNGAARSFVLTPADYVERAAPGLEKNGFFEKEISRKVEQFGSVTHAFSTYESRRTAADPQPFSRGINSIQLLNDGTRWWVVTIYWDAERAGLTIPGKYLP